MDDGDRSQRVARNVAIQYLSARPDGCFGVELRLNYIHHMAARLNLDLDTLRTLALAHDRGGQAQAAEHLGRTPSAISQQMKRLQDDLGVPIFRKRGRGLALTEAGEIALIYARRMLVLNDELLDTMQGTK